MNRILRQIGSVLLVYTALVACSNLGDLEKRVDSIESRVKALESQIESINSNIAALQTVVNNDAINKVEEGSDGTYTLTLTNGDKITLKQGSIGVGNTPVLSVDKDKYWMVDYGDGAQYLEINGEKVKSSVTPVFGVDADGNWTVSYDDGKTYETVKGHDGNPVCALPDGQATDNFFEEVVYNETDRTLTLTLKGGASYTVAVVPDFLCAIVGADGEQMFEYGMTKSYTVEMKGVASTVIVKPEGWEAVLSESESVYTLKVTAPVSTKAIIADSNSEISILAISEKGYSAIAKIRVGLSDAPLPPTATVTAGEATETSVSFNVSVENATSWKYLLLKASESAPDAAAIKASGTDGTNATVTVAELESSTEYVLYVLPVGENGDGEIAKAASTTLKKTISDYYAAYNNGEDIEIGGKIYNKATYGEASLIETDTEITNIKTGDTDNIGIFFIKPEATVTLNYASAIRKLLLIGNDPSQKSKVSLSAFLKTNPSTNQDGEVLFFNIDLDATAISGNYVICSYAEHTGYQIRAIGSRIDMPGKPFIASTNEGRYYDLIDIQGCTFKLSGNFNLINLSNNTSTFKEIIFKNNIFYSTGGSSNFVFFAGNSGGIGSMTLENNTLVNVYTTGGLFKYASLDAVYIKNNLIYIDAQASNMYIFRPAATSGDGVYPGNPQTGTCEASIIYDKAQGAYNKQWFYGGMNRVALSEEKEMTILTENPFTGGTFSIETEQFIPNATYSSYGAQR